MDDFIYAFGLAFTIPVTTLHLKAVLLLCDPREHNMWTRIQSCFNLLGASDGTDTVIALSQFKLLLWFLLGIQPGQIDDTYFEKTQITFTYIEGNLVRLYRRAVLENARGLTEAYPPFDLQNATLDQLIA
jgi:hypothetical protein